MNTEAKALAAISKARHTMIADHPFFAVLALSMTPTCRQDVGTMATDGAGLFFNPDWVLSIPPAELRGVVAHEALHVANLHHTRRGGRDPKLWNMAADAVVNRDLMRAGFTLPKDGVNVAGADRFPGMNAEQVYAKMVKDGEQAPSTPAPGGIIDAAPPGDEDARAEAETKAQLLVRQAVMVAKAQSGPGDSAIIARLVGELNAPRRSWRDVVREFAANSSNRDYSWARPNRRALAFGLISPSFRAIQPAHVVVAIDTSGSMDDAAVSAALGEVQQMLDEGACDRVTAVYCDSAVNGSQSWEAGEIIDAKPIGGGGTRFSPVWRWVAENAEDCTGLIYLTDLGSSDFGAAPDYPVIWGTYGTRDVAPWGTTMQIDAHG